MTEISCFVEQFRNDLEAVYHVQKQVDRLPIFDIHPFHVLSKLKQGGGSQLCKNRGVQKKVKKLIRSVEKAFSAETSSGQLIKAPICLLTH